MQKIYAELLNSVSKEFKKNQRKFAEFLVTRGEAEKDIATALGQRSSFVDQSFVDQSFEKIYE